jgi:deazaflavin-dependent oxidoreductase (nitroreductase family)
VSLQQTINDIGGKVMNRSHKAILRLSGGRILSTPMGMPAIELQTIGRKSGKLRSTMLTSPVNDQDRVIIVASKGGDDRHPDWYSNLTANPDVQITIRGETRKLKARTATAAEKAELWPQIVSVYKGYGGYQEKTGRDIPVVICEREAN